MQSIEENRRRDERAIVKMIYAHENVNGIVGMFLKGPPRDKGFSWCSREGGAGQYWSAEEAAGLGDSSGYGMMMRSLQNIICVIEKMSGSENKCRDRS